MYKLLKPYTDFQRADFVVEHQGLECYEDATAFYFLEPNEMVQDGEIIINPNYEAEQAAKRQADFNKKFFNTSLGYIRRDVTMQNGAIKSFLTDILPLLQVNVPIITYNAPDFATDNPPTQNTGVLITEGFIAECKQQLLTDFYGAQNEN